MTFKTKWIIGVIAALVLGFGGWWIYFTNFTGRTSSRYLGKSYRQVITLENAVEIIDVAFQPDSRATDASTTKLITYKALDSYLYTEEFKDVSPLTGAIRWLPYGSKDYSPSWYRSRTFTRTLGGVVNYELPEDCASIISVSTLPEADGKFVKNLVYRAKSGNVLSKEYRDGFVDRLFEGWLEVKVPDENK